MALLIRRFDENDLAPTYLNPLSFNGGYTLGGNPNLVQGSPEWNTAMAFSSTQAGQRFINEFYPFGVVNHANLSTSKGYIEEVLSGRYVPQAYIDQHPKQLNKEVSFYLAGGLDYLTNDEKYAPGKGIYTAEQGGKSFPGGLSVRSTMDPNAGGWIGTFGGTSGPGTEYLGFATGSNYGTYAYLAPDAKYDPASPYMHPTDPGFKDAERAWGQGARYMHSPATQQLINNAVSTSRAMDLMNKQPVSITRDSAGYLKTPKAPDMESYKFHTSIAPANSSRTIYGGSGYKAPTTIYGGSSSKLSSSGSVKYSSYKVW